METLYNIAIFISLRSFPEKQPSLERSRAESQKSAEIYQVRMQMGTWKVIQNEGSRGGR